MRISLETSLVNCKIAYYIVYSKPVNIVYELVEHFNESDGTERDSLKMCLEKLVKYSIMRERAYKQFVLEAVNSEKQYLF